MVLEKTHFKDKNMLGFPETDQSPSQPGLHGETEILKASAAQLTRPQRKVLQGGHVSVESLWLLFLIQRNDLSHSFKNQTIFTIAGNNL